MSIIQGIHKRAAVLKDFFFINQLIKGIQFSNYFILLT